MQPLIGPSGVAIPALARQAVLREDVAFDGFPVERPVGQVQHPQALPYREGMRVLDAILAVGGLTQFASGNHARIVRVENGKETIIHVKVADLVNSGDVKQNALLKPGDVLVVPKKTNYVMVSGQVFNPTAVSYLPGKSAKFYLSQAGGLTQVADKKAVFVIRGGGSVVSAKNNSGLWSGDPLNAVLKPGDSIVVPEKAPKIAGRNWAPILQGAQVAASVALTVAYIHP